MASTPSSTKQRTQTARDRALDYLRKHADGVSKSELRREVGGNAGAFRRLIASMEDKDEIVITEEHRPTCGLTKVVRVK